jgi:hypothetical protein
MVSAIGKMGEVSFDLREREPKKICKGSPSSGTKIPSNESE